MEIDDVLKDVSNFVSPYPPLISTYNKAGKLIHTLPRMAAPFTPMNAQQFEYVQDGHEHLFLYGDRGGGKSLVTRAHAHACAMAYPGFVYGLLRTSYPELIKNHLVFLKEEMESLKIGGVSGSYHQNDHIAYYPNGSKGFYMQAETENQVRNALGVEMFLVIFDEAPTFQWEHIRMISASVRVPKGSGLIAMKRYSGNPIGPCIDELYKYFRLEGEEVDMQQDPEYRPQDWHAIKISMNDNPHLDVEQYRRGLGVGLPEHIRKAWLDGERFLEGALFEVIKSKKNYRGDIIPYHVIHDMPQIEG